MSPSWSGVPLERLADWDRALVNNRECLDLSIACPVCGAKALHRFYQLLRERYQTINGEKFLGDGALWEWCSNCFTYDHQSALVPDWWSCDLEVDAAQLTHLPTAIEAARVARLQDAGG